MKKIYILLIIFFLFFSSFQIYYAIDKRRNTGILNATSSSGAILSIYKKNSETVTIKNSRIKVRLDPGDYTIVGTKNKAQISKNFTIIEKQTAYISLNMDSLISYNKTIIEKLNEKNNFIKILPYIGPNSLYEINYSYDYSGAYATPIINISGPNQDAWTQANDWIKQKGFAPSNLEITYKITTFTNANYTNGYPGN